MAELTAPELQRAVESEHGGAAVFVRAVPVRETRKGATVWQANVHVFDLAGHPSANRAYAWSMRGAEGGPPTFNCVLRLAAIEPAPAGGG